MTSPLFIQVFERSIASFWLTSSLAKLGVFLTASPQKNRFRTSSTAVIFSEGFHLKFNRLWIRLLLMELVKLLSKVMDCKSLIYPLNSNLFTAELSWAKV